MAKAPQSKGPTEYQVAVQRLKAELKSRKLTYSELAAAIGMSESGVKKIFTATDGSFQRLAEICRHVGLSVADLLVDTDQDLVEVDFTPKQQEAFLRDDKLFELYWKLVYERADESQARAALKLSEKQTFGLLRQLDVLGLLKLMPSGRVVVPPVRPVSWVGRGAFIENLYGRFAPAVLRDVMAARTGVGRMFVLRYFKMHPGTYRELLEALKNVEAEFLRRAVREMRLKRPGLQHVRWVMALDDKSFVG